jgi:type IX secretion system PorP/SprF family membrane protein
LKIIKQVSTIQLMKIKFTILLLVICLAALKTSAQQDPQFTQFMHNRLFYNPGFAGSTPDKICANATYRTQWVGYGGGTAFTPDANSGNVRPVGQGSPPTTLNFGIHGNISRIGIGLNIWNDELGFSRTLAPTLNLAYIHPFDGGAKLAAGVGIGFIQKSLDGSKLVAIDQNDPLIPTANVSGIGMDLSFGLYYTMPQLSIFEEFYFGASTLHINTPQVTWSWGNSSKTARQDRHYYAFTGANYNIGNIMINPNMIYKTDGTKHSADVNVMATYNQTLMGGLSYRTPQEFSILAGYNFPFGLMICYSYDLITSSIVSYSQGSHEIALRYCFGLKPIPRPQKTIFPIRTPRML